MKLQYDEPLSNFAFDFNLRRYTKAAAQAATEQLAPAQIGATAEAGWDKLHADPALFMGQLNGAGAGAAGKVGRCRLTPYAVLEGGAEWDLDFLELIDGRSYKLQFRSSYRTR